MRTAVGLWVASWVLLVFVAGASDRVNVLLDLPYTSQIWFYRVFVWVGPTIIALLAYRICKELQAGERVGRAQHEAEAKARLAAIRRSARDSYEPDASR
jgi:hypothetical protein